MHAHTHMQIQLLLHSHTPSCGQGLPRPTPTQHCVVKAWEMQLKLSSANPKQTHHHLPSGHRAQSKAVNIFSPTRFRAGILKPFPLRDHSISVSGFAGHIWSLSYSLYNLYERKIYSQLACRSLLFPGKKAPAPESRGSSGGPGGSPFTL